MVAEGKRVSWKPTGTKPTLLTDMTPTAVVKGTLPFMQRNISLWLSTRHPVSLVAAALDNACLSVYIHGILILFLCLGWGSVGGGQEYCECFSSRETEVGPTRGC